MANHSVYEHGYSIGRAVWTRHDEIIQRYNDRIAPVYYIKAGRHYRNSLPEYLLQTRDGQEVYSRRPPQQHDNGTGQFNPSDLKLVPAAHNGPPGYGGERGGYSDRKGDRGDREPPPPYRERAY
ncbi:hypothetical protein OEA41_009980 [Lepraria neglecta]|uniref:Uncharacterized protein n=1 Tax=Lepraria neglecta TaxID=209136 RepID=A0AAE0DF52_9LECA|nr:hypothetical protein OEA41_009980 [Lepraria neglecta]